MTNKEKIWTALAAVFGVLILLIGLVAVLNMGDDDEPKAAPETVKTTEPSAEPSIAPRGQSSVMEQSFLEVVREKGITGTDEELLELGYEVCEQFDSGVEFQDFVDQAIKKDATSAEAEEFFYFIGVSVGAFCPEHADKLRTDASSGV